MKVEYKPNEVTAVIEITYWITELPKVNRLLQSLPTQYLASYSGGWIKQRVVISGKTKCVIRAYKDLKRLTGRLNHA